VITVGHAVLLLVCVRFKKRIWDIQLEHRDKYREHLFKDDWSNPPSVRLTPRYPARVTFPKLIHSFCRCSGTVMSDWSEHKQTKLAIKRTCSRSIAVPKCINLKVRHDVMCSTNIVPCLEHDLQCRFAPVSSPYSSANLETKGSSASSFFLLTSPSHLVWLKSCWVECRLHGGMGDGCRCLPTETYFLYICIYFLVFVAYSIFVL